MKTHPITTLKRKATGIPNKLVKDQTRVLITRYGVPTAYIVDVATFEHCKIGCACWKEWRAGKQLSRMGESPRTRRSNDNSNNG